MEVAALPRFRKEPEVIRTLTGWHITNGKTHIDFEEKMKARYCKILAQPGMKKVRVPKSVNEKTIVELDNITSTILETLENNLETITDRNTREKVRGVVIRKIIGKCSHLKFPYNKRN